MAEFVSFALFTKADELLKQRFSQKVKTSKLHISLKLQPAVLPSGKSSNRLRRKRWYGR